MQASSIGIGLAISLLAAGLIDWSVISLLFLVGFLITQYQGQNRKCISSLWILLVYSSGICLLGLTFVFIWMALGTHWNVSNATLLKVLGFDRLNLSRHGLGDTLLFFVPKFAVAVFSAYGLYLDFCTRENDPASSGRLAFQIRAAIRSFALPTVQVIVGSVFPCWVALPYFICSCTGLFHWAVTSNFVGLSWGWRPLLLYNGTHIFLLYLRQLPVQLPLSIVDFADYIGLFQFSSQMEWVQAMQAVSIFGLYMLLCFAIGIEEIGFRRSGDFLPVSTMDDESLHEHLLAPTELRGTSWWAAEQRRLLAFTEAAVCFFACGFPICLVALVCWSFKFASFCALILLVYVGFILYVFPSLFVLRRLNGALLAFILLWGLSTYIFNAGFTIMNSRFKLNTAIWQTIGLWRYSSPGLFIMAQFALGVLVATDLFAGNSILDNTNHLQHLGEPTENGVSVIEQQSGWILTMAVIAWCIHRSAHVISLILIFIVGLRSGLLHACYMAFFIIYLLSPSAARKTRHYLMFYCEMHIVILYVLHLDWISIIVDQHKESLEPILSQLGIWNKATIRDYLAVAALLCFSAIQSHGIKVICSLSATAQQTARYRPFVSSVYGLHDSEFLPAYNENWITTYLTYVGEKFRASYRSFGTYIVYATVLAAICTAEPNYISFGYLLFLLVWIVGRQVLGKTEWPFWVPLFIYTCTIFVSKYLLSVFPDLQRQLGQFIDLKEDMGFDPEASLLWHLWDSLSILAVLQLYKYERCQPSLSDLDDTCSSSHTSEVLDFIRRLLILHSGKILTVAVFYASISPVGALGFVYLAMLVIFTCNMKKTAEIPARVYSTYSSFLLALEYLFQMFGKDTGTNPDQVHGPFIYWLGLRRYGQGSWGIEQGTLSKTLVLMACMLQYCCFQWLEKLPQAYRRSEEPCLLFHELVRGRRDGSRDPLIRPKDKETKDKKPHETNLAEGSGNVCLSPVLSRESSRESKKWSRRAMILKQEKYEAQKQALSVWVKHLLEHFFTFYGIEVTMLALLVASFAVLNIFSLVYTVVLALCVLLNRRHLRLLWPYFVAIFACILVGEYAALAKLPPSWNVTGPGNEMQMHCHDCWRTSSKNLAFCWRCWLGFVDDRQLLVAYFMVFVISCLQLGASKFSDTPTFHSASLAITRRLAWAEISYETTDHWTWLDYLHFAFYRHLLHVVLLLVFITGTLQYDLLHLGYLAFSMVFFRMRNTIMNRRNTVFGTLRFYNFSLILASLIFQAPSFKFLDGRGCTPFSIFGLYKYDYGFRITSRSALVDITIFCLVGLQARIFRTREFDQVLRYLAAEQVEARASAQENKAAWKKEQLHLIREMEDRKIQRRIQVDKMKMDMVPMQMHLDVLNSAVKFKEAFSPFKLPHSPSAVSPSSIRRRLINSFSDSELFEHSDHSQETPASEPRRRRRKLNLAIDESEAEAMNRHLGLEGPKRDPEDIATPVRGFSKQGLLSGVNLLGDVHNLGNKALANLVGLLNLEPSDSDESSSPEDEGKVEFENDAVSRLKEHHKDAEVSKADAPSETRRRLSMIFSYLWSKVIANTDIVCYVLFVLVYVWNFSLLTLVFPASLFLYALLVNPGPAQVFWSVMLIYTELSILLQYMYQIIVNHCGHDDIPLWLKKFGVPGRNMDRSFVASVLPLFLVYLATLVQSSIRARDGEWMSVTEGNVFSSRRPSEADFDIESATPSSRSRVWLFWKTISGAFVGTVKTLVTCWRSLTDGSEVPPHFVQVTLSVPNWPEDGIQPAKIEAEFNRLLRAVRPSDSKDFSRVRVESLEPAKDTEYTALAVLEVIHAAPPNESLMNKFLTSLTPASDVAAEIVKAKSEGIEFPYPTISVIAGGKKQIDLYAYIFGTDLIAFLYVAFFYQSFIKNSPEFLDVYQLEDQFPKEFVFVLMTLFFLIVLDRVLYLSAFAIGKILYYFFTLVLYTSYVTSFVWGMELQHGNGIFFQLLPLRGFYLLKALSLALQASQLRFGIPRKSTLYGQFLMRKISSLSWLGFRIYRALPFLFELRCVLDWSCTTTALSMYDWLKLEDIYASLFLVQCDIKLAREKHRLGEKRSMWIKFCNGLCLFFVLICVIWAPMLIYSSGNPTNFVNDILEAHAQIDIRTSGGSFTLYDTQLCKLHSMIDIPTDYNIDPSRSMESFDAKDVQIVCCEADANMLWLIPPPTLRSLIHSFDDKVALIASWSFHRERPKNKEIVTFAGQPLDFPALRGILNGTYDSVPVDDLYPKYFRITSAGEVRVLEKNDATVSGTLTLNRENPSWWSFTRTNASRTDGCGGVTGPLAIAVSEEVPKGLIGDTLSKFNIWSLYLTFVLAVGRFIRLQCADTRMRIPYENFPSCERLIAICEDIYAARAEGELELEEGLFWTLVKIYRSPHVLIEYTKSE